LISYPDRVLVWASQLRANDFPPVCAMTGAPAETWRKFTFRTTPWWTYLFGAIVVLLVSKRASGYLPLTRASAQKLRVVTWVSAGLMLVAIPILIASIAVAANSTNDNSPAAAISGILFLLFLLTVIGGTIGLLVIRNQLGPAGKVMAQQVGQYDALVELRRVHPAFVAAVQQHQRARAAQYGYAPQSPQQK
jgi:hypothetical protein